ncbi:MAG: hypothetical protein OXF11_06375 [Deltaproteobacteria bacterium]|nr:hypothetical protein [Deltaproteobacteria bacterium]
MRAIVMGTGPIGGIIGGRLARAGHDLTFVDVDREHVAAIRDHGLQVDVPDGAFNVKANVVFPGEIEGTFDTAFIAVRCNYTRDTLAMALPHMSEDGLVVSMQNGINIPLLEEAVGADRSVGMGIRMGSRRTAPGCVHTTTRGHLYVGHSHGRTTPRLEELNAMLDAVIPSEITDNIIGVLWSKLTYTCYGYYGSLANTSMVESCASPDDRRLLANFLGEVVAVGTAAGARFIPLREYNPPGLHPEQPVEARLAVVNHYAESWRSDDLKGPLRQLLNGTRLEVEFTLGHVVRESARLGLSTPLCDNVLNMLLELESGKRQLGLHNYVELAGCRA